MFGPTLIDELRSNGFDYDLQDIAAPENSDAGEALAFNQWRVTAEHRPLGEIMDVRRIYTASAKIRRNQPQREPASVDEVMALPKVEL